MSGNITMLLLDMPEECFLHVASFLAVQDVCAAAATCKQLRTCVQVNLLTMQQVQL